MTYPNVDPNELMATVRDGLRQPDQQDGVIGALDMLGKMRELRAVPLFKQALGHTNNGTRTKAAVALHECGDPEGLAALSTWVSQVDANPKGAVQAMYGLANIKNSQAIEALRKFQREHGGRSLMFRGEQRPVSWIVDSLLGSSSEGGTHASANVGSGSSGTAAQKVSSGCLTLALGALVALAIAVVLAFGKS